MIPEWKHTLTSSPICPHCGKQMNNTWELDIADEEAAEVECGECVMSYRVLCRVYVKYSTAILEDESNE